MEPIVITNYNLKEAQKTIITACLKSNKDKTLKEQAKLLHMSERNLYRLICLYELRAKRLTVGELKALKSLKNKGYKIEEQK